MEIGTRVQSMEHGDGTVTAVGRGTVRVVWDTGHESMERRSAVRVRPTVLDTALGRAGVIGLFIAAAGFCVLALLAVTVPRCDWETGENHTVCYWDSGSNSSGDRYVSIGHGRWQLG